MFRKGQVISRKTPSNYGGMVEEKFEILKDTGDVWISCFCYHDRSVHKVHREKLERLIRGNDQEKR